MKIINDNDFSNAYLTYFLYCTLSLLTFKKLKIIETKRNDSRKQLSEIYYLRKKQ